jgi:hypothetical protein
MTGSRDAAGNLAIGLAYPVGQYQTDFTYRPTQADGGDVDAVVAGAHVAAHAASGAAITVPGSAGQAVTVAPGAARDRFGNAAANGGSF